MEKELSFEDDGWCITGWFEYDEDLESHQRTIYLKKYQIDWIGGNNLVEGPITKSEESYLLRKLWEVADEYHGN